MLKLIKGLFIIALLLGMHCCVDKPEDELYTKFVNPPAEARPFVRRWLKIKSPEPSGMIGPVRIYSVLK